MSIRYFLLKKFAILKVPYSNNSLRYHLVKQIVAEKATYKKGITTDAREPCKGSYLMRREREIHTKQIEAGVTAFTHG